MKTLVVDSTPTRLGPFLKLILTLTLQWEAEAEEDMQKPASQPPNSAANEQQPKSNSTRRVFTHGTTLGPFLTLLLTLHNRSSWIERDWWKGPTAPRGAVLAARYVSR